MQDTQLVRKINDLLDQFVCKRKRNLVVELMNLLSAILCEGRSRKSCPVDPTLGSTIIRKDMWNRLSALSDFICDPRNPIQVSVLLKYITNIIQAGAFLCVCRPAAITCITHETNKCWAITSYDLLSELISAGNSTVSQAIHESLQSYVFFLSFFNLIWTASIGLPRSCPQRAPPPAVDPAARPRVPRARVLPRREHAAGARARGVAQ